jgi:hypothetical protein
VRISATLRADTTRLNDLIVKSPINTGKGLSSLADTIIKDIQSSWFPSSPSPRGGPPAKVTGRLERSLRHTGHGKGGQFARGGDIVTVSIQARAPYSGILESEVDLNRPFFEPALNRASDNFHLLVGEIVRR